jgi:large subunit ribosomal protein L23
MTMAAKGVYMFDVNPRANKPLITTAVKDQFKVDATQVRILIIKGKVKKFKGVEGQRKDKKRAYVTVKKGQKIAVFEINEEAK